MMNRRFISSFPSAAVAAAITGSKVFWAANAKRNSNDFIHFYRTLKTF